VESVTLMAEFSCFNPRLSGEGEATTCSLRSKAHLKVSIRASPVKERRPFNLQVTGLHSRVSIRASPVKERRHGDFHRR